MFTIPKTLNNRFDINSSNVFATNISGHNIWAINISSASAFVNSMTIGTLHITDSSTFESIDIEKLIAERTTMENVRITRGTADNLKITHNTTINLHASYATIPNLFTTNQTVLNLTNNYETVSNVSFNNIIFTNGTGTNLITTNLSTDNIDASSIDTATLIATNLTANSLRFNNLKTDGALYFSQGNLIIGIDNKTIKLDEAKRELYSDSLSFIKGYDPIDIWTADNLATFLGISLIALAQLLGLPENLLPSFIFVRLKYDDVFFETSAGKLTLTGGIENGQILFRDNNSLNGMNELKADIVTGTTTISNLRCSDTHIDFGTFGNLDILSIDYCSQAFLDGNSTINNGYLNNASIENLRLDNSTMNNLDVLNIYTSQLFVDGNGTINNLSVGDLEVTNLTVQNIKHNGSATLNNLDVLSATILETRLDGFSTISNTKILEADVNYIDGDDIWFTNSTFTNIRNSFATLGNVDILSIDSCSRAFIDGQATINNIRGSDIRMENFYGGRFFTSNETPSQNDELASKKYVDDKALRDLTEGDGININNGTISIDIASTPVLGAISISTIPIFGTKLINLDPVYKSAVDQVIVANTIPIPNFLYTGLTNQLFIYLYVGVSVTLVTVTASVSGLTATVETLRSIIDNTNGDVYNLTAGGALMINPNKTINFNAVSVKGETNGVERFRIGDNFKIYEHSNVNTGAKILFNSAYIGVIDSAGAGIAFPNGNIGIGTTTPNYKLDVNGNIGANSITTGALSATTLTAGTVLFTTLSAGTISANSISVANLIALNETVVNLVTTNETVQNLIIVDDLLVTDLSSSNATITSALITSVSATNLVSSSATIGSVSTTTALLTNASISNLTAGTVLSSAVSVTNLTATTALLTNVSIANLTVGTVLSSALSATNISTLSLRTTEATIANIFTTGGNVGIANTAPSYTLDINGDINFTGDLYQNGTLFGGGSSQWTGSVGSALSYTSGTVIMTNSSIQNMTSTNILATNLSTGTIRNNSEIAVGLELNNFIVPTPLAPLDVVAKPSKNNSVVAFQYPYGGGFRHWITARHNTGSNNGNAIDFYLNTGNDNGDSSTPGTNNQQIMTIAGLGVGIGNNSPSYTLDVTGTIGANSITTGAIAVNNATIVNLRATIATIANIFTTGGNVGIGNTAPSYDLDVTGDVNFTGTLYQNGSPFSGGGSQWTGSVGSAISYTSGTVIASNVSVGNITVTNVLATNQTIKGGLLITGGSLKATANDNTIGQITTTFTTTTFANLAPITSGLFAYYNGSSWNGTQWNDLTTNGNHATTIGGTINTTTQNSITYLYGNTSARIRFPTSVLPSTYTLFHVAKYNGNTRQRIFDGVTNNWLSGFWDTNGIGNSGIAFHNQGWLGPSNGVTGSNNFLLSSDQKGLYRANGSVVGTGSGDSTHLSIMDGGHASESSDWAVSEIIVYNRELTTDEIERTESWLMDKYSDFTFTTSLTRSATHTAGTVTLGTYGNIGFFVGISNTAPSYTLDVNGDINFTGDLYQNGLSFSTSQWTGSVGSALRYTSGTVIMTNSSVQNMTVTNMLSTNQTITGTLRATASSNTIGNIFTNAGNVGIGTGSPSSNLTIYTPSSTTFNIQSSSANTKIYSHVDTRTYFQSLGDIIFAGIDSDQLRHLCLRTNGNVGIGTTTPVYRLDVDGDISLRGTQSAPDFIYANGGGDNSCVNIRAGSSSDVWSQIQVQGHWNGSSNTAGNVSFYTRGVQRMRITDAGDVGIGTASPSHKLSIDSGSKTNGSVYLTNTAGGGVINFYGDNHAIWGRRGFGGGTDVLEFHEYGSISFWTGGVLSNQKSRLSILNSDNVVFQFQQNGIDWKTDLYYDGDSYTFAFNYSNGPVSTGGYGAYGIKGFIDSFYNNVRMNFTGQHRSHFKDLDVSEINNYVGLIVRSTGKYMSMNNQEMLSVGKDAISINESLPIVELTTTHKDKAVFGVVSNCEDPNKPRVDKFGCWGTPYNKESGDNRVFINGLGEGALWVSNKNGNLENGDYITTSTIPGYGEKQNEEYIANYTVAKITMNCDFNPQLQPRLQPMKDILGNNVLDTKGNIIWEPTGDYEREYDIRYIDEDGNIITEEEYDPEIHFISAFVGVTYHSS